MIGLSASQVQAELIARYTFDDGTVNDSVGSFHATLTETDYPAVVFEAEQIPPILTGHRSLIANTT